MVPSKPDSERRRVFVSLAFLTARLRVTAVVSASLGCSAILLSLPFGGAGVPLTNGLLVAVFSGGVAALNHRWIAAFTGLGLALVMLGGVGDAGEVEAGSTLTLLPPLLLLVAAATVLPAIRVRLPTWISTMVPISVMVSMPISVTVFVVAAQLVGPGSTGWFLLLPIGAALASLSGFVATRRITGDEVIGDVQHALGDRRWLMETSRTLLLGRISGDLSHELSQSLNVITMANGNLGYILSRVEIGEPHGQQLAERVRRIAGNAEAAAQVLGQFRWFGQDGHRESGDLDIGSALHNAVSATRAAARKSGVAIEIRGDALGYSLPLRHGTIEMMATVALLEIIQTLNARPVDSAPPERIMLEATRTEMHIDIAILCASANATRATVRDDIAQATYDLLAKLALTCRCELRRVNRRNDPVRFILRLDRDMI